jgi:hypothetical protein
MIGRLFKLKHLLTTTTVATVTGTKGQQSSGQQKDI